MWRAAYGHFQSAPIVDFRAATCLLFDCRAASCLLFDCRAATCLLSDLMRGYGVPQEACMMVGCHVTLSVR